MPWWSVYARTYMWLAQIDRVREEGAPESEPFGLFTALQRAHVFYVDPIQASAAPVPGAFSTDRLPFPVILLATGETSGDPGSPPYATILHDWRDEPSPDVDGITVLPMYVRPGGKLAGYGMCSLDDDGRLSVVDLAQVVDEGGKVHDSHFQSAEEATGTGLVTVKGSATALAALELLQSVNVELAGRPSAPRGHRAAGVPCHEVVIRQHRAARPASSESTAIDWSHRWEVRGHYKHFTRGPIFDGNPDRRIEHEGEECVRVWCPPFVKGPDDKPLIPKARRQPGRRGTEEIRGG